MTIVPALNQSGPGTRITVSVFDGLVTTTRSFLVDVAAVNDAPTISAIPNRSVAEDSGASPAYAFSLADVDIGDIVDCGNVAVTSSNPAIATFMVSSPNTGAVGSCSITMTPVADAVGFTDVMLTVSDGHPGGTASEPFRFTVTNVNDAPTISIAPEARSTLEDTTSTPYVFTVRDIDNPPCTLAISSTSTDAVFPPASRIVQAACTPLSATTAERTITVRGAQGGVVNGTSITLFATDTAGAPSVPGATFVVDILPVN